MSKYFVKFEYGTKSKNSAQEAACKHAEGLDGILLLTELTKEDFIKDLKREIDQINLYNRRCSDVNFSTWKIENTTHVSLGDGICYLLIYKVKLEID